MTENLSAYDRARRKLTDDQREPTPEYRAYSRLARAYQERVRLRDEARAAASKSSLELQNWPIDGRHYAAAIDAAMDDWVALGFKAEIEQALATLQAHDPGRQKDEQAEERGHA